MHACRSTLEDPTTSSLPFKPIPGANVWHWSKVASVAAVLSAFGLLLAFELAWVPLWAFGVLGALGLATFTTVYVWLKRRPQGPAPETMAHADPDPAAA